jgi:hypothetical protein
MAARSGAGLARAGSATEDLRPVALAPGMTANPGHCPDEARGKRVVVQLRMGGVHGRELVSAVTPAGWAADDRGACRWTLTGDAADIVGYQVLR